MTRTQGIWGGRTELPRDRATRGGPTSGIRGVVGWDIGGVNIKIARLRCPTPPDGEAPLSRPLDVAAAVQPFEIQRDPGALVSTLRSLATTVGVLDSDLHAVTMTAELSQMFRRKQAGVSFVLDAIATAIPDADLNVYTTRGDFLDLGAARREPLAVAAANWTATARIVARSIPTAIVIDIGTTTTDISLVVGGVLRAQGWTDPDRLRSGELLYLGAIRTPVEAITHVVPLAAGDAGVSAEGFALAGDVHVWRGSLPPSAYTTPTPDGRAVTREAIGERLARVVCADRDALDDDAIDGIADAVAAAQIRRTAVAIARVRARHPAVSTAVVTGIGDFIAAAAATQSELSVLRLSDAWGLDAARAAPATAVAQILAQLRTERPGGGRPALTGAET